MSKTQAKRSTSQEITPEVSPRLTPANRSGAENSVRASRLDATQVGGEGKEPGGATSPDGAAHTLRISVPVPQDGDPIELRDSILRGAPFFFDAADFDRMNRTRPKLLQIVEKGATAPATAKVVLGFARNPDGTTTIELDGALVQDILAFKTAELLEGHDPEVQAMVRAALDPTDPKAQAEALRRLEAVPQEQLPGVIGALNNVTWTGVGKGNADLALTLARVCARYVGNTPGPADEETRNDARDAAERSVNLTAGIDPVTKEPQRGATVDRAAVAKRYREVAAVMRTIGDTPRAEGYEWMARMYESDAKDQRTASAGLQVDRWKADPEGRTSMRPADESERTYPIEAARMRGDAAVNYDELLKNVPTKGVTNNSDGPGVRQTSAAKVAIPELINTAVKLGYMFFGVDAGTRNIDAFRGLEQRYQAATKVSAPPKPEQVARMKEALLNARKGATLEEIEQIDAVLARFPRLEEAARAFWAGAK